MATEWISPTWRMPNDKNQSKFENYSLDFISTNSERIILDNSVDLGLNSTISLWVNFDSTGSVVLGEDSYSSSYLIYVDGTNIYIRINTAALTFAHSMSTGQWYNIVAVRQGDSIEVFRNNTSLGTQTGYGTSINTKFNAIGAKSDGTFPVNGKLSEVVGFDYALSESQRNYLYNSGTPVNPLAISGQPPVAYYPLGGSSTGSASTLTIPNESVPSATVFDVSGTDYIKVNNSPSIEPAKNLTVSVWVNWKTGSNTYSYAINKDYNGSNGSYAITRVNQPRFYIFTSTGVVVSPIASSVNLTDTGWHHLVGTYDGSYVRFYVDGEEIGSGTAETGDIIYNTEDLLIGAYEPSGNLSPNGEQSNVQVWDTSLSATEITTLYNNGVPLFSGTQPEEANLRTWYPMNLENANWLGSDWQIADTTSAYPQSFEFDGVSDEITIPKGSMTDTGSKSVSMWVKNEISSGTDYIINSRTGGYLTNGVSLIQTTTTGYIYSNSDNSKIYTGYQSALNIPNDGNWYHLAWTADHTTHKLKTYINGAFVYEFTGSATTDTTPSGPIIVGQSGSPWTGKLSNLQVWDDVILTDGGVALNDPATGQIAELYNNGSPLTTAIASSNLKGWYKLNNNEIWDGTNWEVENQGYPANYENALDFGSYTDYDYIEVPRTAVNVTDAICISGWIKTQTNTSQRQVVISNYESTDVANNGCWSFQVGDGWSSGYTKMEFWCRPASEVGIFDVGQTSGQVITDNKWHHVVALWDGTTATDAVKIFVDGLLAGQGTASAAAPIKTATTSRPAMGRSATNSTGAYGAQYWLGGSGKNGYLSNVQVWDSALTYGSASSIGDVATGQIAELYNNGTPLTTTLAPSSMKSWYKLDNVTTGIQDSSGNSNNGTNNGTSQASSFVSTQAGVSSGMTASNLVNNNVSALNGTSDGMTTASLVNSDLTRSIPYSSYSMEFDGAASADYIDFGSSVLGDESNLSISFWINPAVVNDNDGVFTISTLSNSQNPLALFLGANNLRLYINSAYAWQSNFSGKVNVWTHVLISYDGATAANSKVYINGVEDAGDGTYNFATGNIDASGIGVKLALGTYYTVNYNLDGKISNLAVWNSSLSADQALTIYNGGVPNDISSLSPTGWWSLAGDSYYDGTDWICPDLSSSSNNGTSFNMPAIALIGDAPGGSANGEATSMDIPTNLKGNAPNSSSNAFSVNMGEVDRVESVPS